MNRAALVSVALLSLVGLPTPAALASLNRADLDQVAAAPAVGAIVPWSAVFRDIAGNTVSLGQILGRRPALLVLADYRCRELCGPILAVVSKSLQETGLHAGRDFDLIVVGLDGRASLGDAAAMKSAQIDGSGELDRAAYVLTGSPESVAGLERSLNYRAVYDPDAHRFAHPTDVFALTPAGAVSRVLPALAIGADDLRSALIEAGQGRIGTLTDRLRLFCYGLDPAFGRATPFVRIGLMGGGLLTLCGLALFMARLRPRNLPPGEESA